MITVKLNDIREAVPVFQELIKKEMTGVNSFKVARLVKQLNVELETMNDTTMKIAEKYGIENGVIPEENIAKVNEEIGALWNTEVKLDFEPIAESVFEVVEMTPEQALLILPFIQ